MNSKSALLAPELSIVVVCYNMNRELPRTLRAMSRSYQRDIDELSYEVIVVDNGSAIVPQHSDFQDLDLDLKILSCGPGSKSPAKALNVGLSACRGKLIGVVIDGARMSSPGMLRAATAAAKLHGRPIIFTKSHSLGKVPQWEANLNGYNQKLEDGLLESINWPEDGYKLFDISLYYAPEDARMTSSGLGLESNFIFMPRILWNELGGYDEKFQTDGGGYLSVDLFIRACGLYDTQVIVINGEATFHQFHTLSASTSNADSFNQLKKFSREYASLNKGPLRAPNKSFWQFQITPQPKSVSKKPRLDQTQIDSLADRYIKLLQQVVLNEPALELEAQLRLYEKHSRRSHIPSSGTDQFTISSVELERMFEKLKREREVGASVNTMPSSLTMIGRKRLDSLVEHAKTVVNENILGDFVECGVWRGGAAMVMAGMILALGCTDRRVWLADSFAGLPPRNEAMDGALKHGELSSEQINEMGLAVSLDTVSANFEKYGLLTDFVKFLPGWFSDTLPKAPIRDISILRLDGDYYGSTMDALDHLYHRVSRGGFVIIDDYGSVDGCKRAVQEFRSKFEIEEPLKKIDWCGVYWRKVNMTGRQGRL